MFTRRVPGWFLADSRRNLGKFSARGALEEADGKRARLRGKLVYRGDQVMIELLPWSVEVLGEGESAGDVAAASAHPGETVEAHGEVTLVGEIVDSKCYYGVMNPGNLKPHRGCAVRCISGGIPPVLLVRSEAAGETSVRYVLLVGPDGAPINEAILDRVAEMLIISIGALDVPDENPSVQRLLAVLLAHLLTNLDVFQHNCLSTIRQVGCESC